MRMAEHPLPSYFETKRNKWDEPVSGLLPFQYDADNREFQIGETSVELAKFDPYKFMPDVDEDDAGSIPIDQMHEHPLMIPIMSGVIGGPKLHEWAAEHHDNWREEVTEVMYEAFKSNR